MVSSSIFAHENSAASLTIKGCMFAIALVFTFYFTINLKSKKLYFIFLVLLLLMGSKLTAAAFNLYFHLVFSYCLFSLSKGNYYQYIKILKIAFYATFIGICLNLTLSITGISGSKIFHVYTSNTYKNSLGFYNPNALGIYALGLFLLFFFIDRKKIDYIIFVLSIYFMGEAAARTTMYGALIFLLLLLLGKIIKNQNLQSAFISGYYLILFIFSLIISLVWLLDNQTFLLGSLYPIIDYITSFRLNLLSNNISNWGVKEFFLGQQGFNPIEMGWYHLFSSVGSLLVICFFGYVTFLSRRFSTRYFLYHSMFFAVAIISLFENFFVSYNIIGLLVSFSFIYYLRTLLKKSNLTNESDFFKSRPL